MILWILFAIAAACSILICALAGLYWLLALPIFIGCYILLLLLWLVPCAGTAAFIDKKKPVTNYSPLYGYYLARIIGAIMTALRVRLQVTGMDKLPEERFLFVGNHRSFIDPLAEMLIFRRQRVGFVAKKELFDIPMVGRLMHRVFCLSLNRGTPKDEVLTIRRAIEVIQSGEASIGIYPEGTRNSEPGLLPFKNGAFKIAQRAECPIVVGVIHRSDEVRHRFPLHRTPVKLEILGVLEPEFVKEHTSIEIGQEVRRMMSDALGLPTAA